jgi:hypothetical protein
LRMANTDFHTSGRPLQRVITLAVAMMFATVAVAQSANSEITGSVTDQVGKSVAGAKVSAKGLAGGLPVEAITSETGKFTLPGLAPGSYEVTVSKEGFSTALERVTVASGTTQNLDVKLTPALSLEGLGFPASATQGNAAEQARLDKRSRMLKMHQRLGLITTIPLAATLLTGNLAGGRDTSSTGRNVHAILGASTAGLYFTSASYAIFAPKIPGTKPEGPIRLHKALAWIHGPGMVLTPILGAMAYQQKSDGQRVHGIASAHGAVAITTAIAYGIAIWSVTVHSRSKSVRDTADQP